MWANININSFLFLLPALLVHTTYAASCGPFNQVYPAPLNLTSDTISSAGQLLNATFAALLANETVQAATNGTSFSVEVFSLHESNSLLTFHHAAQDLANSTEGVKQINSDTIYRLGSISKAWTVYIWLLAAGDGAFNDPITNYISELAEYMSSNNVNQDPLNVVDWSSITVGALASQLSGFSRDPAAGPQGDLIYQQLLGFPPPVHDIPNSSFCGDPAAPVQFYCNRSSFFNDNLFRAPVIPPFWTPSYANLPYQIFAYALENITNTSFPDLFQRYLVEQHGLKSTYYTVPPDSNSSVIPLNASAAWYNVDFADGSPYGGYYSSTNDVSAIARAILNSTYLTPAQTQRWLKPHSFAPPGPLASTNGIIQAVGAPWEIIRAPSTNAPLIPISTGGNVSAAQNYQTWVYTKTGDVGLYSTLTAMIPEFDVGFTILVAGPNAVVVAIPLADLITETYVPALFEASRQETAAGYTGRFVDSATNSSVAMTTPGPMEPNQGMILTELTFQGQDLIALLGQYFYGLTPDMRLDARLYPDHLVQADGNGEALEGWRVTLTSPAQAVPAQGAFSSACWAWAGVGGREYGGVPFDDVRIRVADGMATAVEIPFLQLNLTRAQ